MNTASNKVVALFGPTACGKTDLLKELFASSDRPLKRPVVIVSADSVQVYRHMDIGSAKPDPAFLEVLPHELVDIRNPDESFSLGDFVTMADAVCTEACAHDKLPVISGGTAFYIKGFMFGLPPAPPSDPLVRSAVEKDLHEQGPAVLRRELEAADPVSARRIAPADHYRLCRALEVFRASGRPLSSFELPNQPRLCWNVLPIALERPRDELYRRIELRVDLMMEAGLPLEFQRLLELGYKQADPGLKAIGYAEFYEAGDGDPVAGLKRLDRVSELIKLHTRRYAKRQLTFMRALPGVRWYHPEDVSGITADLMQWLSEA